MRLIDTHSHLYLPKFQSDQEAVITRAKAVLSHVFLPNIDLNTVPQMQALVDKDPDFFFPMMGLHPCYVKNHEDDLKGFLDKMLQAFEGGNYVGVGETGLDYYWDKSNIEAQKTSLRIQLEWAKDLQLPIILHCRESMNDVIELVTEAQDGRLTGIFHCFSGTSEQVKKIQDLGFLMGIGGVLTYKKSGLAETVAHIGLEHLVLETD
ncbi:MAG: TatD family hydrolase, partial [Bacteroidota bacterium]